MNKDIKWRFPGNGGGDTSGLNIGDIETFSDNPIRSLAREIAQNTIDARINSNSDPARLEFKLFDIKNTEIPGYYDLLKEVRNCIDYWTEFGSKATVEKLDFIENELKKENITCLRISDFNTTGLVGINRKQNSAWFNLVHGSAISEKNATSGGSKGIGKFATFKNSLFRTVFYSTNTIENEVGYEGKSILCSGKIPNSEEVTQGRGYYGLTALNEAIQEQLILDKDFVRTIDNYGTDIYILGFRNDKNWQKEIIVQILDSFMCAIVKNVLSVKVGNIEINKNTLKDIVYNSELITAKSDKANIISQYILLTDTENVKKRIIEVEDFGKVELYFKSFDNDEVDYAINKYTMIRYPYMKILDKKVSVVSKFSAICIIPNNELNVQLRKIENPEHTKWSVERIDNVDLREEFRKTINKMYTDIQTAITNLLLKEGNKESELEGASDYIPEVTNGNENPKNNGHGEKVVNEPPKLSILREHKPHKPGSIEDTDGEGYVPEIGSDDENGSEEFFPPEGKNNGGGGEPHSGSNNGSGNSNPNGNILYRKEELRGMIYRFYCINKNKQQYAIFFKSDFDEEHVEIIIKAIDDTDKSIPMKIYNVTLNEKEISVFNENSLKCSLEKNKKYIITFSTDQQELFACEVKTYAYKK